MAIMQKQGATSRFRMICRAAALILTTAFVGSQASAEIIYALTSTNTIQVFDHTVPGTPILPSVPASGIPVTGLSAGENLVSIDFRPSNGKLYGIGSGGHLYSIDVQFNFSNPPATATATLVNAASFAALSGTKFGMDFNPFVDRIRMVSDNEQNLRVNPFNGTVAGIDTNLNPAGNVVDVAYDRNYPGTTSTTLYALDSASDSLELIGSPNGTPTSANTGIITVSAPIGLDFGPNAALDFAGSRLYAILRVGGTTGLYTINPTTGAAGSSLGALAGNPFINGMAVAPQVWIVQKRKIKLNFAKPGNDSISISGNLLVPSGLNLVAANQTVVLNVGGVTRTFTLDEKGKAKTTSDTLSLSIKSKNGAVSASVKATLKKGSFATSLSDEGLTNADLQAVPVQVSFSLFLNDYLFQSPPGTTLIYSAKFGKSGSAK